MSPSGQSSTLIHSTPYPLESYFTLCHLSPQFRTFSVSIANQIEPQTYEQAAKEDCWLKAMELELYALAQNNTWILVDLPPGKSTIGCKWVYKIKHKADGALKGTKLILLLRVIHNLWRSITLKLSVQLLR